MTYLQFMNDVDTLRSKAFKMKLNAHREFTPSMTFKLKWRMAVDK